MFILLPSSQVLLDLSSELVIDTVSTLSPLSGGLLSFGLLLDALFLGCFGASLRTVTFESLSAATVTSTGGSFRPAEEEAFLILSYFLTRLLTEGASF